MHSRLSTDYLTGYRDALAAIPFRAHLHMSHELIAPPHGLFVQRVEESTYVHYVRRADPLSAMKLYEAISDKVIGRPKEVWL